MKTTNKSIGIAMALLVFGLPTACSKNPETKNSAANQPAANNAANANQPAANKPEVPAADTSLSASSSMASPTEAYKTAYTARQKKDIEGLRKVMSKDVLEFLTIMSKEEGKTIEDALRQMTERPQAKTAETRNEKINGDKATLEYLDEKGEWSHMDFIKEDGVWKLTVPKGDSKDNEVKKSDDKESDDKKQQ